ncbi:MAG: Ca-activated chloride channel family protein [Verrucomicrobiales bacterium]|jgi:Ca-activated chloride channel family protein
MTFLGLKFLPWILGAASLALLAFFWALHVRRSVLKRLAGVAETSSIRTTASPLRRRLQTVTIVVSLTALAITVLRPIGGSVLTENRLPAKNLILLFDASKSMGVADSEGLTRLEAAKLFAREFANQRPSDRIGLVSFDGVAFPECPTTLSRAMLLSRLDLQTAGGLNVHGSDLAGALDEASNLLTDKPPPGSAIILLSDGDRLSEDPVAEAAAIIEKKVPIFAVYFGNPAAESPIPNSRLQSRADPDMMRKLADASGGIHLSGATSVLDVSQKKLNNQIDTMKIDSESEFAANLQSRPLELYAYPLALALGCLLLRFFLPARTKDWHQLTPAIVLALGALTFMQGSAAAQDEPEVEPEAEVAPTIYAPFLEAQELAMEKKLPMLVLFTGSDWSEASIKFETEIFGNDIYKQWEERAVVSLVVDLPRSGLDAATRKQRRALASRLGVRSFPTAVFLDRSESELGRLAHDTSGPASWVRRAELILAGEAGASSLESTVEELPDSVQQSLEAPGLTAAERAIRYYNQAMEYRRLDPALATSSPDRFRLLDDLLGTASSIVPDERPDIMAEVASLRAVLHHQRGQAFLPPENIDPAAMAQMAAGGGSAPKVDPKLALRSFSDALVHYRDTARMDTRRDDLTPNLGRLYNDMRRAQDLIDFQEAYKVAVEKTLKILNQETQFRDNLDRWVTTSLPVNDEDLEASCASIKELFRLAQIVKAPMLDDIKGADEDIRLAPEPHAARGLREAVTHIQNAYEHLVKQNEPQSGSGDSEDPFARPNPDQQDGEEPGDEGDEPNQANPSGEQDLRRSQNGSGDLRDRQLDALGRGSNRGDRRPPSDDH